MRQCLFFALAVVFLAGCASSGGPGSAQCGNLCSENAHCDLGSVCKDGCCQTGCESDTDCPDGRVCSSNQCVTPGSRSDGGARDGGLPFFPRADGGQALEDGGAVSVADGGPRADGGRVDAGVRDAGVPRPDGGTSTGTRAVGDACASNGQCATGFCATDFPGGYCTLTTCGASGGDVCPTGSACFRLGSGTSAPSMCIKTCTSPSQCRTSEGYTCDSDDTCWPLAATPDGGTTTPDGGPRPDGGTTTADGGTSSNVIRCNGTPTTCAQIGADQAAQYYGCCAGNVIYWCDDQSGSWALHNIDCPAQGEVCGYEPNFESMYCIAGQTTADIGPGPTAAGPGPTCSGLPEPLCTAGAASCNALTTFNPRQGDGYDDYPLNGETTANQYRSYLRRDFVGLLKYATAKTKCKTVGWNTGNEGVPLGLGDMSEANGAIPGTSLGDPGHPAGTHVDGHDIDLGYYQRNTTDNQLRPICTHVSGGQDQYHCVGDPVYLDAWRHAAFLGYVLEHASIRVIGVDGKAGPWIRQAFDSLCARNWIPSTACGRRSKITFETTDQGQGWYHFHHHHSHISFSQPVYTHPLPFQNVFERSLCLAPDCSDAALTEFRILRGLPPAPPFDPARYFGKQAPQLWKRTKERAE